MKHFLVKHLFKELFIENMRSNRDDFKHLIEDPIIQKIINLPDKVATVPNLK